MPRVHLFQTREATLSAMEEGCCSEVVGKKNRIQGIGDSTEINVGVKRCD
jgi:hypothetical protein